MKQPTLWFRKDSRTAFSALMLGLCLLFYLFFAFYDGAVICVVCGVFAATVGYLWCNLIF